MNPQSVAAQLRLLRAAQIRLHATPCTTCMHAYQEHDINGKCWYPRRTQPGVRPCRCKGFADPVETLQ